MHNSYSLHQVHQKPDMVRVIFKAPIFVILNYAGSIRLRTNLLTKHLTYFILLFHFIFLPISGWKSRVLITVMKPEWCHKNWVQIWSPSFTFNSLTLPVNLNALYFTSNLYFIDLWYMTKGSYYGFGFFPDILFILCLLFALSS